MILWAGSYPASVMFLSLFQGPLPSLVYTLPIGMQGTGVDNCRTSYRLGCFGRGMYHLFIFRRLITQKSPVYFAPVRHLIPKKENSLIIHPRKHKESRKEGLHTPRPGLSFGVFWSGAKRKKVLCVLVYRYMATVRQVKLARRVLVDGGRNIGASMIAVGYSPRTAKAPSKVTATKTWHELMQKYLPDTHLQEKHREFLDAPRLIRSYKKGDMVQETIETDPSAVRALDMAYKLKGRYSAEETNKTLIINISGESATRYGVHTTPRIHEHGKDTAQ